VDGAVHVEQRHEAVADPDRVRRARRQIRRRRDLHEPRCACHDDAGLVVVAVSLFRNASDARHREHRTGAYEVGT
jgi:hypothetical protein